MKRISFQALAALAVLLASASVVHAKDAKQPKLVVKTLDGKSFDLAAQRGHWVVVNFWATWCGPCIKEIPDISAFVTAHKDVTAIGLAFEDTDKADVDKFALSHPVAYPLAQLDVYKPPADFDPPRGLPTTYLIGPDGSVAKKFTGPITLADLETALAAGAAK